MEQITTRVIPMTTGIFRDFVLLGMLICMWKIIVAETTDLYDKVLFVLVGVALVAGNLAEVGAVVRFPLIGAGIIVFCCFYRKKCGVFRVVFMLLLLYDIHVLSFLIADCLYDFLNALSMEAIQMNVNAPWFLEWLYSWLALAQVLLMLVYAALSFLLVLLLKKIKVGSFEMGMRDFCFLSVLNIVGIIFAYMILGISFVKLETEVFMLFDERKDALWKVPLMSALILAGEFSSIYVWQKYRALMAEKENILIFESKLRQIKERLDEADSFYGNIRALKHDIKNHMVNIRNLNAKGEYESAEAYIAKINQVLEELDYKFSTGNTVCDVIVNDKYRACVRENIEFSSDFEFYDQAGVASFDMGIILSNLLDNAIEACRRVGEEERYISLRSKIKGSFVLLEIRNSYAGEIVFDSEDHLPVSTKLPHGDDAALKQSRKVLASGSVAGPEHREMPVAEGDTSAAETAAGGQEYMHGIGLRSSRRVAKKYLGDLKIERTANMFTVIVMLQMNCPVDTL